MPTNSSDHSSLIRRKSSAEATKSINDGGVGEIDDEDLLLRRSNFEHHINEHLEKTLIERIKLDELEVNRCLEREKKFTVDYTKLSRNKIWKTPKDGEELEPVTAYESSVEDYKRKNGRGNDIWPSGRDISNLSVYFQIWDFFIFLWKHTKPYKTVGMIILMSLARPLQNALLGFVTQEVENDPTNVSIWIFCLPFVVDVSERFLYWWYEMWIPLNSQRMQLRCVLISQRLRLPNDHHLAAKWPSGRFTGLLEDVDQVINGIWFSCLKLIDDIMSVIFLLILLFLNLHITFDDTNLYNKASYGTYIGLFFGLSLCVMILPFLWFNILYHTQQDCESMIRNGRAAYMSASSDAIVVTSSALSPLDDASELIIHSRRYNSGYYDIESNQQRIDTKLMPNTPDVEIMARNSYRVFGLTTFRSFFHRLAWTTNYALLSKIFGPILSYILLTLSGFGQGDIASTIIILTSLRDLFNISTKLLNYLIEMSKGCNVLRDIAELLNAELDSKNAQSNTSESDYKGGDTLLKRNDMEVANQEEAEVASTGIIQQRDDKNLDSKSRASTNGTVKSEVIKCADSV